MRVLDSLSTYDMRETITIAAKVEQAADAEELVSSLSRLQVFVFQIGSSLVRLHVLACSVEPV